MTTKYTKTFLHVLEILFRHHQAYSSRNLLNVSSVIPYKVHFEKATHFRDADQILVFVSLSWKSETNLEAVFCVF